jgi:hypothetical protein
LFKNKHTAIEKLGKQGFLCGLFLNYIRTPEFQLNGLQRVEELIGAAELGVAVSEKKEQWTISEQGYHSKLYVVNSQPSLLWCNH